MTLSDLVESLRINAWAPLVLTRAFSSHAARGPGCIVNILDNRITGTDRTHTAYLLSKQILASITRLCALELAPRVPCQRRIAGAYPASGRQNRRIS